MNAGKIEVAVRQLNGVQRLLRIMKVGRAGHESDVAKLSMKSGFLSAKITIAKDSYLWTDMLPVLEREEARLSNMIKDNVNED